MDLMFCSFYRNRHHIYERQVMSLRMECKCGDWYTISRFNWG